MTRSLRRASRSLLGLLACTALPVPAAAQIEHGGAPPSSYLELPGDVPTAAMPPVDVEALLAEDAAQEAKGPLRFGDEIAVDLGFDAGSWTTLDDGDRVWRLRIRSAGAHSLSFVFTEYNLPPGAELYLYNDARSWTYGQFNTLNNKPNGEMAVRPLSGDAVTLEYFEPDWVERSGALRIGTVVHDYRDVHAILASAGADGSCEIDVNCPQGAGWENQVRSTTQLIIGGSLCSGSLVNNTANDGTQLYISAYHCGSMNNAIFQFKYQKSGCGSGAAPTSFTVQGSTQLAGSSSLDFRLARITPSIPSTYEPYYAGWDRTGSLPSSTTTVHHPGGGPKKISFDYHAPQKSGTQWRIVQWDVGVTEGGSSGCPLYTPQGRFIGQLCCGAAFCGFPFDDYYGRLDAQWSLVAAHLDPLGTGQTTLDGFDPLGGGGIDIAGIVPSTVSALLPGSAQTVSILGSGFTPAVSIEVDGVPLTGIPSPYTYVNPSLITFDMPQVGHQGSTTVKVALGADSDTETINVVAPALPAIQAGTGDQPVTGFSFAGMEVTLSSQTGDTVLLYWSPSGLPSSLPGIVELEIANGFSSLFHIGGWVMPAKAWDTLQLNLASVPPSTTFFLEAVAIRAGGLAFPVDSSNRQECMVLF